MCDGGTRKEQIEVDRCNNRAHDKTKSSSRYKTGYSVEQKLKIAVTNVKRKIYLRR